MVASIGRSAGSDTQGQIREAAAVFNRIPATPALARSWRVNVGDAWEDLGV
jgi:hypothetical protein